MFGYVRIDKGELKVKEYDTYKAVYCSLCKKLGKSYGFFSRLTLSYDFTFLALLSMSLKDGCCGFERKSCAFNPLKKCNYCKDMSDIDMPAAAAMIMMYYKLLDNIKDEKGIKKIGFIFIKPLFSRAYKKAARLYPDINATVSDYIEAQNAVEASGSCELDPACEPTARALAEIFSLCCEDKAQKRVLERLGYCIGRYVYILDAACDACEDAKSGSYNVFKAEAGEDIKKLFSERVQPQLYFCINEAIKAFELLDIKKYKSILGNIIYSGLEETFKKELFK